MNTEQLQKLLDAQQHIINLIAQDEALPVCLQAVCCCIGKIFEPEKALSSILLLQDHRLWHSAAHGLPEAFCREIDGVVIGEAVGSCGTAAFRKEQVIVPDISLSPLWKDYRDLALRHHLHACWSTPILSKNREVLGTYAIYYSEPASPKSSHLSAIDRLAELTSIAIERAHGFQRETLLKRQLTQSNEKFKAVSRVMPDLALVLGEDGQYADIFGGKEDLLYKPIQELLGQRLTTVLPSNASNWIMGVIQNTLSTRETQIVEYQLPVPEGLLTFEGRVAPIDHYLPEYPDKKHVLWMARDITARKQADQQIEQLAYYDSLTGLPNRRMLIDRLKHLLTSVRRSEKYGALLYLDLDNFKRINDSLGHSVGDELLLKVAERLSPIIRQSDTLARIGGDEFVVMLDTLEKEVDALTEDASKVSQKIIDILDETFLIRSGEYKIGCSVGISIIDGSTPNADEVLKRADAAMYQAKKRGGNCFNFFDPQLQRILKHRLDLEQEIIRAIKNNEFEAWFQPQIHISGNIVGAEALIRWRHPTRGTVSPMDFIPIAEQFGLTGQLQQIVLENVCQLLSALNQSPHPALANLSNIFGIAVNICAIQFDNPEFSQNLLSTLSQYQHPPSRLKLEITESMLLNNVEATVAEMHRIKALGFRFSVDDFGTGYSSLNYLQSFPIDELKIDRSFIIRMQEDGVGTAIVDAIIALSRHLKFKVIAEGVETQDQANLLIEREIHGMQGYLFARPMPAGEFLQWLTRYLDQRDSTPAQR